MSARDFLEGEAMLDDEENENEEEQEEDYDGEVREGAGTVNRYNDSSEEEEEDDDDEEAARAV
jgi:transcription elongation factor SPT6